jgi:hypothetical protein
MVKARTTVNGQLDKTDFRADSQQLRTGKHTRNPHNPYKSMDVGLHVSDWHELQDISGELGVGLNELAVWILGDFLKRWRAGERPKIEKPLE